MPLFVVFFFLSNRCNFLDFISQSEQPFATRSPPSMNLFYLFLVLSPKWTWGNLIQPLQKKSDDYSSQTNFARNSINLSIYTSQIQHLPNNSHYLSISTHTLELFPKPNPKEIHINFRYFEFWELTRFLDTVRNLHSISGNSCIIHHELFNTQYSNKIGKLPVTSTSPIYSPLPVLLKATFLTDIDNTTIPEFHTTSNSSENTWINIKSKILWHGSSGHSTLCEAILSFKSKISKPAHCSYSMKLQEKKLSKTPTISSPTYIASPNFYPASTLEVTTAIPKILQDFQVGQA